MIHADEREEDNSPLPERPQVEETPRRDQQRRVVSDKGREIPISEIEVSRPTLSQPMEIPLRGEQVQREPERMEIEEMKKDIREGLDEIVEINREETLRKLYGITEDDEQYKIEKEPKSFDDYLQRVRRIGGVLAVMDPWSGIPRFVLSYEKDGIKLYPNFSKYLSRFFDFNPDVDPKKYADVLYKGSVSEDYYGKFKEDKVDEIILQERPVRVDLRKLLDDVEMIAEVGDDDGDDDRGGGRLYI